MKLKVKKHPYAQYFSRYKEGEYVLWPKETEGTPWQWTEGTMAWLKELLEKA